jgi:hypothetical protein
MSVRYRNQFYSLAGVFWQIDLMDGLYTGAIGTFKTASAGFSQNYKGVTERLDPILACDGSVHAIVENSAFEAFMNDISTSQENRFGVIIYKNSVQWFAGPILPDQGTFKDEYYPYDCDIRFSDGLGLLKDVDYSNFNIITPAPVTGVDILMTIILRCLSKTQTFPYFSGAYLKTCVNWYESYQNKFDDPLNRTKVDNQVFFGYGNANDYAFKSCYDVLRMILNTFNARILMTEGLFVIIQPQEYAFATSYTRLYMTNGYLLSTNWAESFRLTGAQRMAGGITKYYPSLLEVTKKYNYTYTANKGNLLPPYWAVNSYLSTTNWLNTIPADIGSTIFRAHIAGNFHIEFYYNGGYTGYIIYSLKITGTTGAGTLYLKYNSYSGLPAVWTSNSADRCYIRSDGVDTSVDAPLCSQDTAFDFLAPGISGLEITGTFQWFPSNPSSPPFGASWTNTITDASIIIDGATLPDYTDKYQSINMSGVVPVTSVSKIEITDTLIGDIGLYKFQGAGSLQIYTGSVWQYAHSWGVHNSTPYPVISINQLSVDQNLLGQKNPVEKYSGKWMSVNLSPLKTIIWGSKIMVPLVFNFAPDLDEASGEWFNLQPMAI